jgi:DNA replication and repair protein RecF
VTSITSLRLTDFRNYVTLDVAFGTKPVVLFGPNGSGKTNLLEALSFLSPGRGMRRAKMEDIARRIDGQPAPAWGVNAIINEETRISLGQVPEYPGRRIIRLNGTAATGQNLAEWLSLMWLTPAQDRLFTGPASDRRKFLDRFVMAHLPQHGINSARYEKARRERNRLLSEGNMDPSWHDALERDLALYGSQIVTARAQTFTRLQNEIGTRDSAFPKAAIALEGHYENLILQGKDTQAIEALLREDLSKGRNLAQRAGRTLMGPHRSDLLVTHSSKSMPAADCSTGEQKALLIGLILAQVRAQNVNTASEAPDAPQKVLLLDEVAAHLDIDRRAALIEELLTLDAQVFMTGTDASLFEAFQGRAQMLAVNTGQIKLL